MIQYWGGRKFVALMFVLIVGTIIAFTREVAVLIAYGDLASKAIGAFMLVHGVAEWKNGGKPAPDS